MRNRLSIKSITELLVQASIAYDHDGPEYLRERMVQLLRELRATCDDTVLMLTDYAAWECKQESQRDTGELEAVR